MGQKNYHNNACMPKTQGESQLARISFLPLGGTTEAAKTNRIRAPPHRRKELTRIKFCAQSNMNRDAVHDEPRSEGSEQDSRQDLRTCSASAHGGSGSHGLRECREECRVVEDVV